MTGQATKAVSNPRSRLLLGRFKVNKPSCSTLSEVVDGLKNRHMTIKPDFSQLSASPVSQVNHLKDPITHQSISNHSKSSSHSSDHHLQHQVQDSNTSHLTSNQPTSSLSSQPLFLVNSLSQSFKTLDTSYDDRSDDSQDSESSSLDSSEGDLFEFHPASKRIKSSISHFKVKPKDHLSLDPLEDSAEGECNRLLEAILTAYEVNHHAKDFCASKVSQKIQERTEEIRQFLLALRLTLSQLPNRHVQLTQANSVDKAGSQSNQTQLDLVGDINSPNTNRLPFDANHFLSVYFQDENKPIASLINKIVQELKPVEDSVFEWQAPTNIAIGGSYMLRTCLASDFEIDINVTLPNEMWKREDIQGHCYAQKRLLYLAALAEDLIASSVSKDYKLIINWHADSVDHIQHPCLKIGVHKKISKSHTMLSLRHTEQDQDEISLHESQLIDQLIEQEAINVDREPDSNKTPDEKISPLFVVVIRPCIDLDTFSMMDLLPFNYNFHFSNIRTSTGNSSGQKNQFQANLQLSQKEYLLSLLPDAPQCLKMSHLRLDALHNHHILREALMQTHLLELQRDWLICPSVRRAALLSNIWVHSNALEYPFNSFLINMMYSNLLHQLVIDSNKNTLEMFKSWLFWIINPRLSEFQKEDELVRKDSATLDNSTAINAENSLAQEIAKRRKWHMNLQIFGGKVCQPNDATLSSISNSKKSSKDTSKPEWLLATSKMTIEAIEDCYSEISDAVLIDRSGYLNLLFHVSHNDWDRLQYCAWKTWKVIQTDLANVNNTKVLETKERPGKRSNMRKVASCYQMMHAIFSTRAPMHLSYDLIFGMHVNQWARNTTKKTRRGDNYTVHYPPLPFKHQESKPSKLGNLELFIEESQSQLDKMDFNCLEFTSSDSIIFYYHILQRLVVASLSPRFKQIELKLQFKYQSMELEATFMPKMTQESRQLRLCQKAQYQLVDRQYYNNHIAISKKGPISILGHDISSGKERTSCHIPSNSSQLSSFIQWPYHAPVPLATRIWLGAIVNRRTWLRVLEYGPSVQNVEQTLDFKRLWGQEHTGIRKFKDGQILQCVIWTEPQESQPGTGFDMTSTNTTSEVLTPFSKRYLIPSRVLKHVLDRWMRNFLHPVSINSHLTIGSNLSSKPESSFSNYSKPTHSLAHWTIDLLGDSDLANLFTIHPNPSLKTPCSNLFEAHERFQANWNQLQLTLGALKDQLSIKFKAMHLIDECSKPTSATPPIEATPDELYPMPKSRSSSSNLSKHALPLISIAHANTVLLVAESHTSWPDDLNAIIHLKNAFYFELAEKIKAVYFNTTADQSMNSRPNYSHLLVTLDGVIWIFHGYMYLLQVFYPKESKIRVRIYKQIQLLQRMGRKNSLIASNEFDGSMEMSNSLHDTNANTANQIVPIERNKVLEQVRVSSLLYSLNISNIAYSGTCHLVKIWLSKHLLNLVNWENGLFIDLLVARIFAPTAFDDFTYPSPSSGWKNRALEVPQHVYAGFYRVLSELSILDPTKGPILVPILDLHSPTSSWSQRIQQILIDKWKSTPLSSRHFVTLAYSDGSSTLRIRTLDQLDPLTRDHMMTKTIIQGISVIQIGNKDLGANAAIPNGKLNQSGLKIDYMTAESTWRRMQLLARQCLKLISTSFEVRQEVNLLTQGELDLTIQRFYPIKMIFEPSLTDFDLVIECYQIRWLGINYKGMGHRESSDKWNPFQKLLQKKWANLNPSHFAHAINPKGQTPSLEGSTSQIARAKLSSEKIVNPSHDQLPPILFNFQPIEFYVQELQQRFGSLVSITYCGIPSNKIGISWRPSCFTLKNRLSQLESIPITDTRSKNIQWIGFVPNIFQILKDIHDLGNGLVSNVHMVTGHAKLSTF